jgi:hypothetical protein
MSWSHLATRHRQSRFLGKVRQDPRPISNGQQTPLLSAMRASVTGPRSDCLRFLDGKSNGPVGQTWKDDPQPQAPDMFGLPNLKPDPCGVSTKSTSVPSRY